MGRYFGAVRVSHVGETDGAEENGVCLLALVKSFLRERDAGLLVMRRATFEVAEVEGQTPESFTQDVENLQAGSNDLGADAVAREDGDVEAWVSSHPLDSSSSSRQTDNRPQAGGPILASLSSRR